jgi:PhnB protein
MAKTSHIPEGMGAVTPYLVIAGAAEALDFYVRAFGAVDELRMPGPDGKLMHAQMRIGGAAIMLGEEAPAWGALGPKTLNGSPVNIHLYVEDADAFMARAEKAGARVTMPAADMFWGDRYGKLEDPFGHRWSIATHVREVSPGEMMEAMRNMPKEPA